MSAWRTGLQSLVIPLVAGLFICLLTGNLQHQRLMLAWPLLIEPDSVPWQESLLASLPAMMLFILLARWMPSDRGRALGFVLFVFLAAFCNCLRFAESFGSTWSTGAILSALLLGHLHLLALALLPGALLLGLIRLALPARPAASPQRSG